MKAKVPKGSRQRRRASNTKLIVKAVINRISVIPRVGPLPVESIIGHGVINGEAYSVKKVSSERMMVASTSTALVIPTPTSLVSITLVKVKDTVTTMKRLITLS
jgi:hypothetical protein